MQYVNAVFQTQQEDTAPKDFDIAGLSGVNDDTPPPVEDADAEIYSEPSIVDKDLSNTESY